MEIKNYRNYQKEFVMNFMKERYELYDEHDCEGRNNEIKWHTYLFRKSVSYAGRSFDITIQVDDKYKDWKGESSITTGIFFFYPAFPWRMWNDQAARVLELLTGWSMRYCKMQARRFSNFIGEECRKIYKDLERLEFLAA